MVVMMGTVVGTGAGVAGVVGVAGVAGRTMTGRRTTTGRLGRCTTTGRSLRKCRCSRTGSLLASSLAVIAGEFTPCSEQSRPEAEKRKVEGRCVVLTAEQFRRRSYFRPRA